MGHRQRIIKKAEHVYTNYNDYNINSSNISEDNKSNTNDNNISTKFDVNNKETVIVQPVAEHTSKIVYNKSAVKSSIVSLNQNIKKSYNNSRNNQTNYKNNKRAFRKSVGFNKPTKFTNIRKQFPISIKYTLVEPRFDVSFEEPTSIKEILPYVKKYADKRFVYDIECEHNRHTFIANDMLVHNSVYVSFEPLFKAMTEESQKKFYTDEKKLKFIEDFSRDFLNQQNNEWCENIYNPRHGHSYHEFELESIQKSQLVDKKKKYIKGVVWMKGKTYDEPHMSATGIEIVKSTTPKLCRTILTDLIRDMMFVSPNYKDKNEYAIYFNSILAEKKKEFFSVHFQDISNSVSIGDYKKYVIDDQDQLIWAPKCPVSVKAISMFNHLAHKNGKDNLRITSGKIKYYYIKTGPKASDVSYFGYPAGTDEPWFPPCDRTTCWDKNIIVPMNRFASVIKMPLLSPTGEYSLSLF